MSDKKTTENQNKADVAGKQDKKPACGCGCTPLSGSTQKTSSKKA